MEEIAAKAGGKESKNGKNENIKRSMRASEYAKTAPAGSALMTNHLDTVSVVNKNSPIMDGM